MLSGCCESFGLVVEQMLVKQIRMRFINLFVIFSEFESAKMLYQFVGFGGKRLVARRKHRIREDGERLQISDSQIFLRN